MKTNSNQFSHGIHLLIGVTLCATVIAAWGGVVTPLYVGNSTPVLDEYGRSMLGSNLPEESAQRYRVELRTSTTGFILPPQITGAPHPFNPLLSPDSVGGMGMNTSRDGSGLFAMVLTNRPAGGTKIFARAFNAATIEEASFYADTVMAEASASGSSLGLTFGAATPLDDGDDDGDGLNNSWEKAMGTDAPGGVSPEDWDGDGMLDLHEMLAGTVATNANSMLAFRPSDSSEFDGGGEAGERTVRVRWQSVPGKQYQLQYVPTLLGLQNFLPVLGIGDVDGVITAAEGEFEIDLLVEIPEGATAGSFRVRLIHDGVEP